MFLELRAESWVFPFQKPCGDSEGELRLISIEYDLAEPELGDLKRHERLSSRVVASW